MSDKKQYLLILCGHIARLITVDLSAEEAAFLDGIIRKFDEKYDKDLDLFLCLSKREL